MQWGRTLALASLIACGTAPAANAEPHRLYDAKADCAVFGIAGFAAIRVEWDGPCVRGLAAGHGAATLFDKDGKSEILTASFRDGGVLDGDADIAWSDGAHYRGATVAGRAGGIGVLTDAGGNRFEGTWQDGELNGHGTVVWANGDRYDGDWKDGKASGHGVQVWANGESYDGAWANDQPNGQGTFIHKDGSRTTATFVDGKRQPNTAPAPAQTASTAAPAAAPTASPMASDPVTASLLEGLTGKTLVGVDGSTVTLAANEGGLIRTVTASDGSVQKAGFAFLGNGLGTITDGGTPAQVIGFFRILPASVELTYADGHSETLTRSAGDGISLVQKTATGELSCSAWYPAGHAFSSEERKAAVAAYARRLGVGDARPHPSCAPQAAAPAHPIPSAAPAPHRKPLHGARETASLAVPASLVTAPNGLQTVPVKPSTVHLIDEATEVVPVDASAIVDEKIASNCLKVDSDGAYWGFRNHCSYNVQFAYCLLRGVDEATMCGDGGVPGSVPANGFGALFADRSMGERGTERDFRWVGCRGGAGEVTARLDHPEPASGRCVSPGRTASRD